MVDTEFLLHTVKGPVLFKLYNIKYEALKLVINEFKEKYLEELENEKIKQLKKEEKEKSEEKIDRLIQLGEMYENGLLSEEEFASMKQKLFEDNDEDATNLSEDTTNFHEINDEEINFCENCGTKIIKNYKFCTNCGHQIK